MKTCLAAILVVALVVVLMLASVTALVQANIQISPVANPALRGLGLAAELVCGILWLLGTTYIATRLATGIFGKSRRPAAKP